MLNAIRFRLLGFFCILLFQTVSAQKWEVGGFVGGSNYAGDLARVIVPSETNFSAGAFGKYNFTSSWSYRFGINYAKISGGDYNFSEYKNRNLDFFSPIWELDNRLEFNYRKFGIRPREHKSTPYVFTGLNVFYFNPKTRYNGTVVNLHRYGTEGQKLEGGKNYLLVGLSIPLGIGYRIAFTENWVFGAEIGFRKTFTDYLDDVSKTYPEFSEMMQKQGSTAVNLSDRSAGVEPYEQKADSGDLRGNPNAKDWYLLAGVTLTYRFTPIRCGFSNY